MLSDIEIAHQTELKKITEIAATLDIDADEIELYGNYKAKLSDALEKRLEKNPDGKLILVTAINPTPAGEGKTTTSVGLGQAMPKIGKKAIIALREPSLGPVFGVKGGAAGGGYSQVVPMEDINLHFTGDFHAITAANNLLCAMIDNHIQQGNALDIDTRRIIFKRCLDMNDRVLRNCIIGLGGTVNGVPREDHFMITVASEIMAILCLAKDIDDLKERLGNIIFGYSRKGTPLYARDLKAVGAMAALLKDAVKPNLVQTLEHTPCLIHGGPFANIAHGCNSILATKLAMTYGDYVVTEAGFGADLGAEKFYNIKCRKSGLQPKLTVIVATTQGLKMHGGVSLDAIKEPNMEGLQRGFANLDKHIANLRSFGQTVVVAFNRFATDVDEEVEALRRHCQDDLKVGFAVNNAFMQGGEGAVELARLVVDTIEQHPSAPLQFTYADELGIEQKVEQVAGRIYGASEVTYSTVARQKLKLIKQLGITHFPVCIAKTQFSFTADQKLYGVHKDFEFHIRDFVINNGAEMIVAIAGEILRMPGLPKSPQAERIDIVDGHIEGLS